MKGHDHPIVGRRVQVPAYTDSWMMGDMYGVVMRVSKRRATGTIIAHVMMDKSNRTKAFIANDCRDVGDYNP